MPSIVDVLGLRSNNNAPLYSKRKLLLYHHITTLPSTTLAHQFLQVQEELNFPSLKDEIEEFLTEHEIVDVRKYSKEHWKDFVKEKIVQKNRIFLLEGRKKYKKLDIHSLALEEFGLKEYFLNLNLSDSRMKFRVRSQCVNTCQSHFPSNHGYAMNSFQCINCSEFEIDQLSHWHRCHFFKDMIEKVNTQDEKSVLQFYRSIIKLRQDQIS